MMPFNGRFIRYQSIIDALIKSISTLYLCSCRPLVITKEDGSIDITGAEVWLSEDAKKSYAQMQKNLRILLEEQALIQMEIVKKENSQ